MVDHSILWTMAAPAHKQSLDGTEIDDRGPCSRSFGIITRTRSIIDMQEQSLAADDHSG